MQHEWEHLAVGRVCRSCLCTQPKGQFDDSVPCEPRQSGQGAQAKSQQPPVLAVSDEEDSPTN